jgi:transposase-like protein
VSNDLSFEQFCQQYDKEADCIQALFAFKWPNRFCCPRCTHQHFYLIRTRRLPLYQCHSCHSQTSLIVGTIFEGSRTPLRLWFQAIYLHAQPEGVCAKHLTSIIGTTYKTAWLICHKIRQAISNADSQNLISGLVRVNWGNYGSPYNPTIFRHHQEQPLLVGASLGTDGEFTQLKIKQVKEKYLQDNHVTISAGHIFSKQHVDPEAIEVIIINQKYSRNRSRPLIQICLNASQWINDLFKGIGPKHLQSYLDQYCFGYNTTKSSNNSFTTLLHQCLITPVLTYPQLILRENPSLRYKKRYFEQLRRLS